MKLRDLTALARGFAFLMIGCIAARPGAQCVPDTLLQTIPHPAPEAGVKFGSAVAADGNRIVVGVPWDNTGAAGAGRAYVFNTATGALLATLNNPTPRAYENFGNSVAVSGNLAVVGSASDDAGSTQAGAAYVFNATTGALVATLSNPDPTTQDKFGESVAISGNVAVVGATQDDAGATDSGTAYVFNALTGALLATLNNPSPASQDIFGWAVAISGNLAVVGAPGDDAGGLNAGTAYAFNATTGALLATLYNPAPAPFQSFGNSAAISGDLAVVGVYHSAVSAAAYVFSVTTGALVATLNNPSPAFQDYFGGTVAISGNLALVGAFQDDTGATDAGEAYLFDATTGALLATLDKPTPSAQDYFGWSVALTGNVAVVGATQDDVGATEAGGVYTFTCDIPCTPDTLLQSIGNPVPAVDDEFGFSVAVDGNLMVVGAPHYDALEQDQGRAYVFNATTGALVATLDDPTPTLTSYDNFGNSVAISGNLAVVGAYGDDPDGLDPWVDAGSAYVFNATTGALVATLDNPARAFGDNFGWSVAIFGDLAVVGANQDDAGAIDAGTAYVFNATTGVLVATLYNPAPAAGDNFGASVAISGNWAVVGASGDDAGATDAGTAYVFNASTGALTATLANPAPAAGDFFGASVAIDGNLAMVGANQDDAGATDAGTAYLFNASTGALTATLANPAPAGSDNFGGSVALSGYLAVVGAYLDDAGATDTGSAVIFACDSPTPTPTESPTATPTESPTPSPTPAYDGRPFGDFDSNQCTNLQDFLFLLDYWETVSPIGGDPIGLNEFLALLDNWETGPGC